MGSKQELLSYINDRTINVTRDADTFLWARMHHYSDFEDGTLGGGNLLIALGLFATMSYLAKIYHILGGGEVFTKGTEARSVHQALPSEQKSLLQPRRDGDINETDAFAVLIAAVPTIARLGLREDDVRRAYRGIRNGLAHLIAPRMGNTMAANTCSAPYFMRQISPGHTGRGRSETRSAT